MEVILLSDVEHVGLRGDVVSVAPGYARNYLLPRRLAEEATTARVAELQKREGMRARHEAKNVDQAREIVAALAKTVLRFEVKAGPTGSLFGSVTPTDIADELWSSKKIRVDRRKIETDPIKRIGRYEIPIGLFEDIRAEVKTEVIPEGGELPPDEVLEEMEAAERAEQEEAAAAQEPQIIDCGTGSASAKANLVNLGNGRYGLTATVVNESTKSIELEVSSTNRTSTTS